VSDYITMGIYEDVINITTTNKIYYTNINNINNISTWNILTDTHINKNLS
jgi:hypothetical protein